LLFSRLN
jgi:hypothetical protein